MRIVAGRHRGRPLLGPDDAPVRPTADRTREALFNILSAGALAGRSDLPALVGARVLDAFAGTGALGLEALSRGARQAVFMEMHLAALAACRRNVATLGEEAHAEMLRADVTRPPRANAPCDIVFMDPPYNQGLAAPALGALEAQGWLARPVLITLELMAGEDMAAPAGFTVLDQRRYGKAGLLFIARSP